MKRRNQEKNMAITKIVVILLTLAFVHGSSIVRESHRSAGLHVSMFRGQFVVTYFVLVKNIVSMFSGSVYSYSHCEGKQSVAEISNFQYYVLICFNT